MLSLLCSVSKLDVHSLFGLNDRRLPFDVRNPLIASKSALIVHPALAQLRSTRRFVFIHDKRGRGFVAERDKTLHFGIDLPRRQFCLVAARLSQSTVFVENDINSEKIASERTCVGLLQDGREPQEVLESSPEWNPSDFWDVVDFLAAQRRFEDVLQVFDLWKAQEGYEPREQHYATLIRIFGRANMPEVAQHLFEEMKARDIQASVITYSALLQAYAESGYFDQAEVVLAQMLRCGTKPNAVTYTGLIYAYGKNRRYDDMDRIFNNMKRRGCSPDFRTYSCLIEAYSRGRLLRRMDRSWKEMNSNGWAPDSATINAIIQGYAESGFVKEMHHSYMLLRDYRLLVTEDSIRSMALAYIRRSKFRQLRLFVKDVSLYRRDVGNLLWNLLLLSYAASFQMRNLQKEFQAMRNAGFSPDLTTFNIRALGFSRMEMFWDLHVTVLHMSSDGVAPDLVTFGAVVDAYIMGRLRFQKMFEALDELQMKEVTPDVRTDPIVFEAFGKGDFHSSSETLMQSCRRPFGRTWTYGKLTSFYLNKRSTNKTLAREFQSKSVREKMSADEIMRRSGSGVTGSKRNMNE